MIGRRIACLALAGLCFIALAGCDSDESLPNQPRSHQLAMDFHEGGPPSTLTITTDTCDCNQGRIDVTINDVAAGQQGCGEQKQYAIEGTELLVTLRSLAVSTSLTIRRSSIEAGVSLRARCSW
jgi:hypothetical protein